MNAAFILSNLKEAVEELQGLIAEFETSPDLSFHEYHVAMAHAYHHLNTAWNARYITREEWAKPSEEDFKRWEQQPTDLPLIGSDGYFDLPEYDEYYKEMWTCSLCRRTMPEGQAARWRSDSGEEVTLATSSEPFVVIDMIEDDELRVCERCYVAGLLPASLSPAVLQAVHLDFAREYRDLQRFADAIQAGERALEFGPSADVLAELAYVHNEQGGRATAAALYRRALALDPSHFMATENLKQLEAGESA